MAMLTRKMNLYHPDLILHMQAQTCVFQTGGFKQ